MSGESRSERNIAEHVGGDENEIPRDDITLIEVSHGIPDRRSIRFEKSEAGEGRRGKLPTRGTIQVNDNVNDEGLLLDILFHLIGMGATVEEYILDAGAGKKLECILDERNIGQGKKTLSSQHDSPSITTSSPLASPERREQIPFHKNRRGPKMVIKS